jgi:hypothetical protein
MRNLLPSINRADGRPGIATDTVLGPPSYAFDRRETSEERRNRAGVVEGAVVDQMRE